MVNIQDESFFPEEDDQQDNTDQLQEHTGTVFGSFNEEDTETTDDTEPEETGEDEREHKVTGSSPGAGFNDGTNDAGGERGNSGGPIGNLAGKYDTNSSSAGGSGTMEKGPGGDTKKSK